MPEPIVSINQVSKSFGQTVAVNQISLEVMHNEFLALLGPSGCGKTTLLRMIAGLETPDAGHIEIDGQNMAGVPPNKRPVNMVFQSYAVFPHMTVAQNIGYGLKVAGGSQQDIRVLVDDALQMVQLDGYGHRKPDQLSGGQRQRVALARALVKRPRVLLLDEPLSALDARLREQMQEELTRLQRVVGITFVIVTHDQTEALSMADRIAVLNEGRLVQIAVPDEIYQRPATKFVAEFIGRVNLLQGRITGAEDDAVVVELPEAGTIRLPYDGAANDMMVVAVRPEKIQLSFTQPRTGLVAIRGTVTNRTYQGDSSKVEVTTPSNQKLIATVRSENAAGRQPQYGDTVWASWAPEQSMLLGNHLQIE